MQARASISPMKLPKPFSWTREDARSGKFDGKFLIGVRTTGIYCLPSCPTHPPKTENVTLYRTEAECQAAGLRACKRCRPDLYLSRRRRKHRPVRRAGGAGARRPGGFRRCLGAGARRRRQPDQTGRLCSANMPIWRRPNGCGANGCASAAELLLTATTRWWISALRAGFESESVFHRQFLALTRMTPGAYRALGGAASS